MSLGTFLKKAETWGEGLFTKVADEFEAVWLPATIAITNALATVLNDDPNDIIGGLVGKVGTTIENDVRNTLLKIVPELQLAQQWKGLTANQILTNVLTLIGDATANTQTAFYIEFSGMVANDFAQGNLTVGEAVSLAEYFKANTSPTTGTATTAPTIPVIPTTPVPSTPPATS